MALFQGARLEGALTGHGTLGVRGSKMEARLEGFLTGHGTQGVTQLQHTHLILNQFQGHHQTAPILITTPKEHSHFVATPTNHTHS